MWIKEVRKRGKKLEIDWTEVLRYPLGSPPEYPDDPRALRFLFESRIIWRGKFNTLFFPVGSRVNAILIKTPADNIISSLYEKKRGSGKRKTLVQFSSVQSLSCVRLFVTPWIAACQASLSITNSQSSLRLICIESVMPSSHLIFCRPLLLLPLIPPSIRVFSNESALRTRWPKYCSLLLPN